MVLVGSAVAPRSGLSAWQFASHGIVHIPLFELQVCVRRSHRQATHFCVFFGGGGGCVCVCVDTFGKAWEAAAARACVRMCLGLGGSVEVGGCTQLDWLAHIAAHKDDKAQE